MESDLYFVLHTENINELCISTATALGSAVAQ